MLHIFHFCKNTYFSFICFDVHTSQISDKTVKFMFDYINLFWGPFFIGTQWHKFV